MRYIVEFGVRGGHLTENVQMPSARKAARLCSAVSNLLVPGQIIPPALWYIPRGAVRAYWVTRTHFIAVSVLDGVPRGPASALLWPLNRPEGLPIESENTVRYVYPGGFMAGDAK